MAQKSVVKKFRPITPGQRQLVLPVLDQLTGDKPTKSLMVSKKRINGRNNTGRITCRHRGGGHKRTYRIIDFKRDKLDIPGKVATIEYDPNRSAFIALVNYADGEKRYILAPRGLKKGDRVETTTKPVYKPGICMALKNMPLGSVIHGIEMVPGRGALLVRSAGTDAQLMARSGGLATIRMPSGEVRMVPETCKAAFGTVSNPAHNLRVEGKAGRMRWKGIRPTVRGTAMNPCDHPHGGGEGRHNGYIPQTPWAKPTKGLVTRKKSKSKKMIVKPRRKR